MCNMKAIFVSILELLSGQSVRDRRTNRWMDTTHFKVPLQNIRAGGGNSLFSPSVDLITTPINCLASMPSNSLNHHSLTKVKDSLPSWPFPTMKKNQNKYLNEKDINMSCIPVWKKYYEK